MGRSEDLEVTEDLFLPWDEHYASQPLLQWKAKLQQMQVGQQGWEEGEGFEWDIVTIMQTFRLDPGFATYCVI